MHYSYVHVCTHTLCPRGEVLSPQNLSLDSSPLLNTPVKDLEEEVVRDLLTAELCTTSTDQKEFVSGAGRRGRGEGEE